MLGAATLAMVDTRGSAHHGNCSNRKPNTSPRSIGLGGGAEFTDDRSGHKARYGCADSNRVYDEACEDLVMMFSAQDPRDRCFGVRGRIAALSGGMTDARYSHESAPIKAINPLKS